jgi:LmbE family N-acetylglucosaminyl deacetylase
VSEEATVSPGVARRHPIDQPGTAEAAWRAWPGLAALPPADPAGWGNVLVVAAHPDDEVLGAGGILGLLAAAGARIRLVAVTDGEASHPGYADPGRLAGRRAAETTAALARLGLRRAEVVRLQLPDSRVAAHEGALAGALRELAAGFDTCLAPWDGDLHADHEATGRAARRAVPRTLGYPVWAWHWASPGDPRLPWHRAVAVRLPAPMAARKRAAIGCFASQLEQRDGLPPVLPPGTVAHFTRPVEVLFR